MSFIPQNSAIMATLAVILVSLLVRLVCGEYSTTSSSSTSSGGGGCVYSFQVWRPNQDVLDQLHHLDQKCSNTTSNLNHQIVLLKNQLLNEVVVGRNISQGLERQLMHQKMERLQLDVMTKDLQLQMVQLKGEQRKIMNRVRSTGGGGEGGGGGGRFEEGELKGMMEQLKNDVGDLKAEWVFIRRKIQDVHDEAKQSSERLREDSMQLKVEVESMKAGAVVLGQKHGELSEQMQKIKEDGNGGMRSEQEDRLLGHVRELQAQLGHLGNGLSALQQQHATLAQQLLAVVMTTNNVSNDDLASWMQKMPRMGGEVELGRPPRDCHEAYESGRHVSGAYEIQPETANHVISVYCHMEDGVGWTVFQRRVDGTLGFNRRWLEYKYGFGSLYGEFWLGNDPLHLLTSQLKYKLRVDMWDWEGNSTRAEYGSFGVESEAKKYALRVKNYLGDAVPGDSLSYHDGMAFSTEDTDNDLHRRHCAQENKGGWWFNSCFSSHLNGVYHTGWYTTPAHSPFSDGIVWYTLKVSEYYSLRRVEMKVAPAYA